jgi:hypothetical protein
LSREVWSNSSLSIIKDTSVLRKRVIIRLIPNQMEGSPAGTRGDPL